MHNTSKNNVPWELISASITNTLTSEEKHRFDKWLSSDPKHKKLYADIKDTWDKGISDYSVYREADEDSAWKALQLKMTESKLKKIESKVNQSPARFTTRQIVFAFAAVFTALVGLGLWFIILVDKQITYQTYAIGERFILDDGSSITLQPHTKIKTTNTFNKTSRTVRMITGEAYYEVVHIENNPFVVELGQTQVIDIGTSFTINKGVKQINVSVTSGKVEFINFDTKEKKALSAGTKISYDVERESFSEIKTLDSPLPSGASFRFDNTPLSEAALSIEQAFDIKIDFDDENISARKITANLQGMSLKTIMEVIGKTLAVEYSFNDSVYVLRDRK